MPRMAGSVAGLGNISPAVHLLSQIHHHASMLRPSKPIKIRNSRHTVFTVKAQQDENLEEPDWDQEMSIFKKRQLKPSQLEALRKLEEQKLDLGTVLYCKDSIAIVEGLNNDAEVGTALSFASGAKGVLVWRRSDNIVFALLLGGSNLVAVGDRVECRVRGILQVLDETEGPSTKKEYDLTTVPVGNALVGQVVDFLGRPLHPDGTRKDSNISNPVGTDKQLPLLNQQPDMESREQITESLVTGVKSLDILTPLGRGQALLVAGPQGSGKSQLCIDAVVGQRGQDVRCVYAAIGCTGEQLGRTVSQLVQHGAMEYTTVVAATADSSLGEQYAALAAACSMAEAVRDGGGASLVVLNDIGTMVRMWEAITVAMADLGSIEVELRGEVQELKEEVERTVSEAEQTKDVDEESSSSSIDDDNELVEYEGMLVSVAAAQRRRFFSSLIQRCAKMHRRLRGGSMTSLLVTPGVPATGNAALNKAKAKLLQYKHLSEEQKAKLLHALEKQEEKADEVAPMSASDSKPLSLSQELRTEVVEEFMSIADGQVVLRSERDPATNGVLVNPQLSISRIGGRAYAPAIADLAAAVRLDLSQAEDARKFAANAEQDKAATKALKRAEIVTAALAQQSRSVCLLEQQVVHLLAVRKGYLDTFTSRSVNAELNRLYIAVQEECGDALNEIAKTRRLTATAQAAIEGVLSRESSVVTSQKA